MKDLITLFNEVNYGVKYITVGEDVDYCFMQDGETLYIYLAPSNGKVDWAHNFMFKKRPYKDMKTPYRVHRGFLKCWKTIEDIVIERIQDPTIKEIITIGYSHGGALAVMCHECCWFHRPDIRANIYGISFDGPRVYGNWWVKKSLRERWEQFVVLRNDTDIVTHVPPWLFGYSHVGKVEQFGKGKKYGCVKAHYPANIVNSLQEYKHTYNWKEIWK